MNYIKTLKMNNIKYCDNKTKILIEECALRNANLQQADNKPRTKNYSVITA
jgi:hypothetical protein